MDQPLKTPVVGSMPSGGAARDWLVVLLLTGAMIFSLLDRIGIAILIEPIKVSLGIGDRAFGLLNGLAFGLFYSFMGMPLGWLADRWSRKGTIMLGIGIWSVSTAMCGLASSFPQLLAARIFVGAGEAGLAPAAYGIIHDRFGRRNLATAMSVLQVGSAVGSGCALLVAGTIYGLLSSASPPRLPVISALAPWQQTFVCLAVPGVLFLMAVPFIQDRPNIGVRSRVKSGAMSLVPALKLNAQLYLWLFSGMSACTICSYSMLSWLPAAFGREFGWTPAHAGRAYGFVVLLCAPLGLLCGGWACDFLGRRNKPYAHSAIPLASSVGGLCGACLLPLVSGPNSFLAVVAWTHFCIALPLGVVPALIQLLTPAEARGRVSAVYVLLINFFGLGVASVVIGGISSHFPGEPRALRMIVGSCAIVCFGFAVISFVRMQRFVGLRSACLAQTTL